MPQNLPTDPAPTEVRPYKSGIFDAYLTFCALGGMTVTDTGGIVAMTQEDFCRTYNVDRHTLNRWKQQTPNFAELQRKRRDEIFPLARETAAFNRLFLIGMTSLGSNRQHNDQRAAVDALKTLTGHFSELRLPTVKQEVEVKGGFLDMMSAAAKEGVIEGEVVYADDTRPAANAGGESQDPGALPSAS